MFFIEELVNFLYYIYKVKLCKIVEFRMIELNENLIMYIELDRVSCFRVCFLVVINFFSNWFLIEGRFIRDNIFSFLNFFNVVRISFRLMFWYLLRYSFFKIDFNELDNMLMVDDVRREYWLRLIDVIVGVMEISVCSFILESWYVLFKDREDSIGKFFGDFVKVEGSI